jgi:hypothetical protein
MAKFEAYLLTRPDLLRDLKAELRGKVLGCWCKPAECHGDVLARYANSTENELLELLVQN